LTWHSWCWLAGWLAACLPACLAGLALIAAFHILVTWALHHVATTAACSQRRELFGFASIVSHVVMNGLIGERGPPY